MNGNIQTSGPRCSPAAAERPASPSSAPRRFVLALPSDNSELLQFGNAAAMPGLMRIVLDRSPDYFNALRVEGRNNDVLTFRDDSAGRLLAVGHRSTKSCFVDGVPIPLAYLGGLRVDESVRSASFLTRGYRHLLSRSESQPASFGLTTIMESNTPARRVLPSRKLGLPSYHDLGRFCCVAASLQAPPPKAAVPGLALRRAHESDAAKVIDFLHREGRSRQFFPVYEAGDFGCTGGLLQHLEWNDVLLAFRGGELVGTLASWDQRSFRRWRIAGYAPPLRILRRPLNVLAALRNKPALPPADEALACLVLALTCIKDHNRNVFRAMLGAVMAAGREQASVLVAGLHERDPLGAELLSLPHVPLHSRLYAVAENGDEAAVRSFDRERVPYLETGSL